MTSPVIPARSAVPWQWWYAALTFIWGSSYLFTSLGLAALSGVQVTALRAICGAAVLLLLLSITRTPLPRSPRTWAHLLVTGTLLCTLPWTLFALGQERVTSAVAGISNAITPVAAVLATALLLPGEPVGRRRQLGVAIGFVGVLLIFQPWSVEHGPDPVGLLMVLAASASYGVGWTYVRRFLHGVDPGGLSMPTAQVLVAAVQVPLLLVADWWWRGRPAGGPLAPGGDVGPDAGWPFWGSILAVLLLGVLSTGLAQAMQYAVVRAAGPTVATSVTYPIIVVSVALGVFVLGEHVGPVVLVGAAVVLLGSLLITRAGPARSAPAPGPAPASGPAPDEATAEGRSVSPS